MKNLDNLTELSPYEIVLKKRPLKRALSFLYIYLKINIRQLQFFSVFWLLLQRIPRGH